MQGIQKETIKIVSGEMKVAWNNVVAMEIKKVRGRFKNRCLS